MNNIYIYICLLLLELPYTIEDIKNKGINL